MLELKHPFKRTLCIISDISSFMRYKKSNISVVTDISTKYYIVKTPSVEDEICC